MAKVSNYPHGGKCECDNCVPVVKDSFVSEYSSFILIEVEKRFNGWWVKFKLTDNFSGVSYHNWPLDLWNNEASKHGKKQ